MRLVHLGKDSVLSRAQRPNSLRRAAMAIALLAFLTLPLAFLGTARAIRENENDLSDGFPRPMKKRGSIASFSCSSAAKTSW